VELVEGEGGAWGRRNVEQTVALNYTACSLPRHSVPRRKAKVLSPSLPFSASTVKEKAWSPNWGRRF